MQSNIIKMILAYKGLTITELAELLGKSQNNFSKILKRDNLREKELEEIANALNCDLSITFTDRDTGKTF